MIQQRAQKPKPLHHLLLPTVSQIKTSVGTVATGHEKCIISGCSALPGSLRRLQWRKMLQRDGWALFLEICLNRSQVFDCSMRGYWLQWASYFRLNGCLSALGPIGTFARQRYRRQFLPPKKSNLECFVLVSVVDERWLRSLFSSAFLSVRITETWFSLNIFSGYLRVRLLDCDGKIENWWLMKKIDWTD